MRFVCGDVRGLMFRTKLTTELRIGATEPCNSGGVSKSAFARFSASFDFRLLQHYPSINRHSQIPSVCLKSAKLVHFRELHKFSQYSSNRR